MIRVVAVDDHPPMLDAVKSAISEQADMQLVATAEHGSNLMGLLKQHPQLDVATLDLGMNTGDFDPVACICHATKQYPSVKVLVITNYVSGVWARMLVDAGASGYLLKSDAYAHIIVQAIRKLAAGGRYFSPQIAGELIDHKDQIKMTFQERWLLLLMDQGKSTQAMAGSLCLSEKRISNLITKIYAKLGVKQDSEISQRTVAINTARKLGLLPDGAMDPNLISAFLRTKEDDERA